jgi:hypothetical protein
VRAVADRQRAARCVAGILLAGRREVEAEDLLLTPEEAARTSKQLGTFKLPATIDVTSAWLPSNAPSTGSRGS